MRLNEKGGLVAVHQKGSHRYFADRVTGDIVTTVPMHSGDLPRSLLKKIIIARPQRKDVDRDTSRLKELNFSRALKPI